MGMARRAPTPHELDKMLEGMRIAAREGAFGFSTGLVYAPCSYSDTSELEVLVQETARFGGIFVVHMRDEGHYLLRSFEEVAGIALAAGAHLHISHLQAYGRMNWRLMDDLLERVEELAGDGLEVSWDRYPYLASSTVLMAVLPIDPGRRRGGPRAETRDPISAAGYTWSLRRGLTSGITGLPWSDGEASSSPG